MRPRLNLLYVGTLPPHPGGSAIVASYLLPGLLLAGHRVRALAPFPADTDAVRDRFAIAHPGISVLRFTVQHHSNSFDQGSAHEDYRRAERDAIRDALPRLLADEPPDIVVIGRESIAWHTAPIVQRARIPSLMLVHGGATFAGVAAAGHQPPQFRRLRREWRRIDRIVVVATHLARVLAALGFRNTTVIPNPVDIHRFSPGPKSPALLHALGISRDDFVVVHASNLRPVKRPGDIVASASIALRTNPRLLYLIVGDGPCRAEMETTCREKGIASRFRFPGWIEHSGMPDYFRVADLILMPSESEGQSLVYLEAQACGRVLVASRIDAAHEVISDGETGVLFNTGRVDDLVDTTLRMAADPLRCARIGARARVAAAAHAVEAVVSRYLECLVDLAERRRHVTGVSS